MDSTSVPTAWIKNRKMTAKARMNGKVFFMNEALAWIGKSLEKRKRCYDYIVSFNWSHQRGEE